MIRIDVKSVIETHIAESMGFDKYKKIMAWYGDFLKTENGRDCIAEFDKTLPGYTWLSDVKKIDFYLWNMRV